MNSKKTLIHELADVQSKSIGNNTRVWQFCVIMDGAEIGQDCNICANVLIENEVKIGDRVTIKSGVQLWNGLTVENDVFIGPNTTFTNDLFPRSKVYPVSFSKTIVEQGCSIGANATILANTRLGKHAMIGAGAVVTRDVPPYAIVTGNPAHIIGYVNSDVKSDNVEINQPGVIGKKPSSKVNGVSVHRLPEIVDMRGSISFAEVGDFLPFEPMRYFLVYDVKSYQVRGEHAHHKLEQFLVCVKGSCSIVVDDGTNREEYELNSPGRAIHIPPMTWSIQYKFSSDAVLMVLASSTYDADSYIRDYDQFIQLVEAL